MTDRVAQPLDDILWAPAALDRLFLAYDSPDSPLATVSAAPPADQAVLMLREAPRLPAVAHDTGDWLHTAVYLAIPGHRVVSMRLRAGCAIVTTGSSGMHRFR
jgi:hypothetical protein